MPLSFIENAAFGSSSIVTANGIKFPATQVASADANVLDDYEEGTFTPVLSTTGGALTYTTTNAHGRYTKIGNVVYFWLNVNVGSISGPSGNIQISLPFSIRTDPPTDWYPFTLGFVTSASTTVPSASMGFRNTQVARFWQKVNSDSRSSVNTDWSFASSGTSVDVWLSGSYCTN